ncbi:universal stress protein [Salinicola corii]|uniref:Universal stress protein n=1 Tax=Salinicola corii TaxID=2606937 RepID=A0A640W7I7_9GAMM|nr:universal stress protein [Salinicola corii]KAA0015572.1 universal stress protein [Salinicola corii]
MQNAILIPMGKEKSSMAALRKARGIAQSEHSRLYLLHVVVPEETGDVLGAATGAATHALDDEDFAAAKSHLEAMWHQLNEPMAAVNFVVKAGEVSETIVEEARRLEVDTIFLETSHSSPKWVGKIAKMRKRTPCRLTVVDEEGRVVLEHVP